MIFPRLGDQVGCESIPNTQIAVDELGYRWYKKGPNSTGTKIFHTWALVGCYARAYAPLNQHIVVITREHDMIEHENAKDKEHRKSKFPNKSYL